VIPEIFDILQSLRPKNAKVFVMPTHCPECDSVLARTQVGKTVSVALYCMNAACPAKHLENLIHFVSKKGMNIEGLGEKIIETFHDLGLITDTASIFNLKKEDIEGLEGFGEKSAENIIASIESARTVPLHRFIYSLGIRHVGEQTAKDIANHLGSFDALKAATLEELSAIEGVGEKVAGELASYFSDVQNVSLLARLLKQVHLINPEKRKADVFDGKTFVITGTLPTLSRDQAKELIEKHGGKVAASVSKNTSYLLAGEGGGSKRTDAEKLGISVISEEDLTKIIQGV
jgi:DNA ligase (NAD+)